MLMKIFLFLSLLIISCRTVSIPLIRDVIFIPLSRSNNTIITNRTCLECLCMNVSSQLLLNCFPNNTCQFFSNFPRTYKIQPMSNATLYFPQAIFPEASQCCMPNLTDLLDKLKTATPTYAKIFSPRCLFIDNHGYLVTISRTNSSIVRFNTTDLTMIDSTSGLFTNAFTLEYYNGDYYIGTNDRIVVVDSSTLTVHNNITSVFLNNTRDMMFLDNGNTLVVASTQNGRLLFFNRSDNFSTNYDFNDQQLVHYLTPHGLFRVNDRFFYTTSWGNNTVYSYSAVENTTQWDESLFINAASMLPSGSGSHITVDECGRWWFTLFSHGLRIFDDEGVFLDNMTLTNSSIFDTLITENYIFYFSDGLSNRIIRIDPSIEC